MCGNWSLPNQVRKASHFQKQARKSQCNGQYSNLGTFQKVHIISLEIQHSMKFVKQDFMQLRLSVYPLKIRSSTACCDTVPNSHTWRFFRFLANLLNKLNTIPTKNKVQALRCILHCKFAVLHIDTKVIQGAQFSLWSRRSFYQNSCHRWWNRVCANISVFFKRVL